MNKMKISLVLGFLGVFALVVISMSSVAYDRTEYNDCGSACHGYNNDMELVADQWLTSKHANSYENSHVGKNTYCAQCHSPLEGDFSLESSAGSVPVPESDWQAVTCASCHPEHDLRVEWGTPIGIFTGYDSEGDPEWTPVYDANELCTDYCHADRHGKEFQGFGDVMHTKKDVKCIDCHMADSPSTFGDMTAESHTFNVADNLPYSCGIGQEDCHENKNVEWAQKQIDKEKIHGKDPYGQTKEK